MCVFVCLIACVCEIYKLHKKREPRPVLSCCARGTNNRNLLLWELMHLIGTKTETIDGLIAVPVTTALHTT